MLTPLQGYFTTRTGRTASVANTGSIPRRRRARKPSLESLETRQLLSFIGSEHPVSSVTDSRSDYGSANASSAYGTSVVVWTHQYSSTDRDIYAQRYDIFGNKVGGIVYVDTSGTDSGSPSVSMDAYGNFAVTYNNYYSNGTSDVQLRVFSSSGAQTASTTVSSSSVDTSSGYGLHDYTSDVAFQGSRIVVAYNHYYSSSDSDVLARRYTYSSSTGLTHAGWVYVATTSTYDEYSPSIAMSPNGNFDVAYQRYDSSASDSDVLLNRYSSGGGLLGTSSIAVDSTHNDFSPDVAMDDYGNAVVAWEHAYSSNDHDIYARRVSSGGTIGSIVYVRTASTYDYAPTVALSRSTGHFVVGYVVSGSTARIGVSEFDGSNTRLSDSSLVTGYDVSVSMDGFNRYLVSYTKGSDVYSRRDFVS